MVNISGHQIAKAESYIFVRNARVEIRIPAAIAIQTSRDIVGPVSVPHLQIKPVLLPRLMKIKRIIEKIISKMPEIAQGNTVFATVNSTY